ncbi:MAG: FKBP-type peptidyl-prolyl cis-trans isomerase [Flavobacteriales bacterium]
MLFVLILMGEEIYAQFEGYDSNPGGLYSRILAFGDDALPLSQSDLATLEIGYSLVGFNHPTTETTHLVIMNGSMHANACEGWCTEPDSAFLHLVDGMMVGDKQSFILPFRMIHSSAFEGVPNGMIDPGRWIRLDIHYVNGFTYDQAPPYLMQACQQGELAETKALDLLQLAAGCKTIERPWEVGISWSLHGTGVFIQKGKTIRIRYTTHLLDGTSVDEPTEMEFVYGKPDQVVEGLHYALSYLQKGDRAKVYVPSHLGFGVNGLKNQIVPRNTPLYFDLQILTVR